MVSWWPDSRRRYRGQDENLLGADVDRLADQQDVGEVGAVGEASELCKGKELRR